MRNIRIVMMLSGTVIAALGPLEQAAADTEKGAEPLGSYIRPLHYHQRVHLEALSPAKLEELKQPSDDYRRYQIGLGRTFPKPIVVSRSTVPLSQWTVLPDGWSIWSAEVGSESALGLRIHIQSIQLPKGGRIVVYDPSKPEPDPDAITPQALSGRREVWTATLFNDRAIVECQLPPGADPMAASFVISGVSHLYALPMQGATLKEGSCHNDVTCYPSYADQASGVARMSFVDGGNTRVCSGALLAANDTSQSYFLTANHCVYDQTIASTIELYWFYQTSSCNGSPPSLGSVPRTSGGADLLATSNNNDFSFMRLRQKAPSGANPLSWSTSAPSSGDSLACIHHPTGAYKRISFGNYIGSNANFWGVRWNSGVTEPGSSGSPLLNGNHELIGQLNAGFNGTAGSSCTEPTTPDQFGRFDLTYPAIQQWLSSSSPPPAPTFVKGTYTGLFFDQSNGPDLRSSGTFTVTTTTKGRFSANFKTATVSYSVSGQLDSSQSASFGIPRRNVSGQLQVDPNNADHITGFISDGNFNAQLDGNRAVFDARSNPAGQAGQYTMIIPSSSDSSSTPGGDSFGTVTVDRVGRIHLAASLGDGTKFSQAAILSGDGRWPLYSVLYGKRGFILSWINFADSGADDFNGSVTWGRPNIATAKVYPQGFVYQANISGSHYTRPDSTGQVLDLSSANVSFTGGSLDSLTDPISIGPKSRVTNMGDNKLNLTFSASNGTFRGAILPQGLKRATQFNGVVFQKQNAAFGYFIEIGDSGSVTIR